MRRRRRRQASVRVAAGMRWPAVSSTSVSASSARRGRSACRCGTVTAASGRWRSASNETASAIRIGVAPASTRPTIVNCAAPENSSTELATVMPGPGVSTRELARRHRVHRRDERAALVSPIPPARKTPVRVAPVLGPYEDTTRLGR